MKLLLNTGRRSSVRGSRKAVSGQKNKPVNIINVVSQHITRITKLPDGHFTLLESGVGRVAVFRMLSFPPVDETSITRLRVMTEVTPKVQTTRVTSQTAVEKL